MKHRYRIATVLTLTMVMLPTLGGIAFAQLSTEDPNVTVTPGGENCNGIVPTGSSRNTVKTLVGGSLVPGGDAQFLISYPVDPQHLDDGWEVVDCVLILNGATLKDGWTVLDQKTFNGVINSTFFSLNLHLDIPDDIPVGTTICNVAKTTEGPSAPQQSNRKAGPACFTVGGAARVEKQDPDGNLLAGATFEITNCVNAAVDPNVQPLLVDPTPQGGGPEGIVVADEGFIAFNGAAGSSCTVTEIAAPDGYLLPDQPSQVVTIPVGTNMPTLFVFVNEPVRPEITVTKSCTPTTGVGDTVVYTITVENTGTEPLVGLSVDDSLLGDITSEFAGTTLDVGESMVAEVSRQVQENDPDDLENIVTATAEGATTGQAVEDTDSCNSFVARPAIEVTKSCTPNAGVGDTVIYTITVTNTGNEQLNDLDVDDTLLGNITAAFGTTTLDVGQSIEVQLPRIVQQDDPDQLENVVVASATGAVSGAPVSDEARCQSDIGRPGIDVSVECTPTAHVGDTVIHTITITNTGNETLNGLTVSSSLLDLDPLFPDTLAPGESLEVNVPRVVLPGDPDVIPHAVSVSAVGGISGDEVSDEAACQTEILRPGIALEKDGDTLVHVGDTVTYTFTVTNTGNVPLASVGIIDPLCDAGTIKFLAGDANVNGLLDLEESWSFSCTHVVTAADGDPIPNVATAEGFSGPVRVTDTDDHLVDVIHPAINIVKTVSPQSAAVGTLLTYTMVVTNTGDTPLSDVILTDVNCTTSFTGGDTNGDLILDLGETWVYTCQRTMPQTNGATLDNTASVEGTDELGLTVTAQDTAIVVPLLDPMPPTGSEDVRHLGLIGGLLLVMGLVLNTGGRRRLTVAGILASARAGSAPTTVVPPLHTWFSRTIGRARGSGRRRRTGPTGNDP